MEARASRKVVKVAKAAKAASSRANDPARWPATRVEVARTDYLQSL